MGVSSPDPNRRVRTRTHDGVAGSGGDRHPYADHSNCKRARSGPPPLRTRLFGKAETLPVSAYRPFLRFVSCQAANRP